MYISCITFYQFSGEGHRGRAGWKVSPILIKGTPHFSPPVPSFFCWWHKKCPEMTSPGASTFNSLKTKSKGIY